MGAISIATILIVVMVTNPGMCKDLFDGKSLLWTGVQKALDEFLKCCGVEGKRGSCVLWKGGVSLECDVFSNQS